MIPIYTAAAISDEHEDGIDDPKSYKAATESSLADKWDTVGADLSAVIMWVGFELSAAEPHALSFLCTCQLDLARASEFSSIERFRTPDTVQQILQ